MFLRIAALLALTITAARPETLRIAGLKKPAEILIDKWGVPHIYAKSFDDAFFIQGFNAARDRLFQIDLWRRRGLGEVAEVLGPEYLDQDRAARLFLYRGDMEKEWAAYGSQAKRIAIAFAAGINAYIDSAADRLPVEFQTLGYRPAKWKPEDVVRIRTHGLTGNLTAEVTRAGVICKLGPQEGPKWDQFRVELQPAWDIKIPDGLDPCLPATVLRTFQLATQTVRFGGSDAASTGADGSNNWTIAARKSSTGRPILASDPHRAYSTPSLRYIAHISAPGLSVIGGGEPSLPGVSIGHNGTSAWGLTRFYIDQEDLYVYELNPSNARDYRYRGAWEPMRVLRETIRVKGRSPVEAELLFTRHGPVLHSDSRRAYAVRSAWLEPGTAVYFGSSAYMTAKNYEEFQQGVARALAPGLNYVYADTKGDIGWTVGGMAPVRRNWDGLLPVPGDGRYEWEGFWRATDLPSTRNPSDGFFSTSNEMNLPSDYPVKERKLGFEWGHGARHARIDSVLRSTAKISIEDSMRLQYDIVSLTARRLVALLAALPQSEPAVEFLRGWDGVERAESAQAALMEVWISRHLGRAFLQAMLPKTALETIRTADAEVMLRTLESAVPEKKRAVLLASLRAAFEEMQRLQGRDPKAWQWGKLHHSLPAHPLLDVVDASLRAKLQVGPFPKSGGPHTPNQSAYRSSDFRQTSGASFRVVVDVGQWDNSRAINYPGQSGVADDPHYRDLAPMWLKGEYFPLLYSRQAVEKATERRIALQPR